MVAQIEHACETRGAQQAGRDRGPPNLPDNGGDRAGNQRDGEPGARGHRREGDRVNHRAEGPPRRFPDDPSDDPADEDEEDVFPPRAPLPIPNERCISGDPYWSSHARAIQAAAVAATLEKRRPGSRGPPGNPAAGSEGRHDPDSDVHMIERMARRGGIYTPVADDLQ